MNKTISAFVFVLVLVAIATVSPAAQAQVGGSINESVVASTTATTTVEVKATTTVATTTPATSTTIAGLIAQLQKLTALFNELKAKLASTQAEIKELRGDIREGMTDADIKTIQELLASDSTIYPQGLVTGYFGPMTKEAIKRFQAKNGLEVTGEIDTETRAAMDAIIAERKADGKFPVGLLLAPGLKDKFEYKLKDRCDDYVKATTTAAHPCMRVKAKYNFWNDKYEDKKDKMEDDEDDDDDSSKVPTMRDSVRQIADAEEALRDIEKKLVKKEYVKGLSSTTLTAINSDIVKAKKDIADAKAALVAKDYVKASMLAEKAEEMLDDAKDVLEGEDEDDDDDEDEDEDEDDEDEDEDEDDN